MQINSQVQNICQFLGRLVWKTCAKAYFLTREGSMISPTGDAKQIAAVKWIDHWFSIKQESWQILADFPFSEN